MCRSGKSKPVVWRSQARFMAEGVEGLTRDKTRKMPPSTSTRLRTRKDIDFDRAKEEPNVEGQ